MNTYFLILNGSHYIDKIQFAVAFIRKTYGIHVIVTVYEEFEQDFEYTDELNKKYPPLLFFSGKEFLSSWIRAYCFTHSDENIKFLTFNNQYLKFGNCEFTNETLKLAEIENPNIVFMDKAAVVEVKVTPFPLIGLVHNSNSAVNIEHKMESMGVYFDGLIDFIYKDVCKDNNKELK